MDKIILSLLSIAFVLTDWKIGLFTFGDIFLFLTVGLVAVKKYSNITANQIIIILGVLSVTLLNILLNNSFNVDYSISDSVAGGCKILIYLFSIIYLYNYIKNKRLEVMFLGILSSTAVIICILGIYISISILLKGLLPYKFFWEFTRTDLSSYMYRGWGNIIRTRSLFSEPGYLGYYLNAVLGLLYFNKVKFEIKKSTDIIITLTILATFSFGAILTMIAIKSIKYLNYAKLMGFLRDRKVIVGLLIITGILIKMWDLFEETLIIRFQEVLSGADTSATARISGSWSYINYDNILLGNGLGNTPPIWNVYAYILSDLGLIVFCVCILFNFRIFLANYKIGIVLLLLNFQKGGYLASGFWITLLLVCIYSFELFKAERGLLCTQNEKLISKENQ
jgi:hypothetical protein